MKPPEPASFQGLCRFCCVLLVTCALRVTALAQDTSSLYSGAETVGLHTDALETPVNQLVRSAGRLVELPGVRPNALALSPDGRLLVTSGRAPELLVLDPASGAVRQRVPFPPGNVSPQAPVSPQILQPTKGSQLSFTGLTFSPDGHRVYLANVNGDIKVFVVGNDKKVSPLFSFELPQANAPRRAAEIPAGLAVSKNGKRLYVALNLSNRLAEMDTSTGKVLRLWDAGVAPFGVALVRGKVYVSNWGGPRPAPQDRTGPAGRGTLTRVDARGIANEASVSVIRLDDRETNSIPIEIPTGLRPCALMVSPDERYVVVANSGSDTLTVIEARSDKVVETICARRNPADLFGAQPNALAFDRSGKTLFACNGTQNAVSVFRFKPGDSQWQGLVPAGWFPAAIVYDAHREALMVANLKQHSPGRPRQSNGKTEFNTTQYYGSLSLIPVPEAKALQSLTTAALQGIRYPLLKRAGLPARLGTPAQPVPERVGEPSVFRHVLYIIKENCAYDQVLGDVAAGNGDPELCVFGKRVTPNQHKLVREFALLDNTYCCSILSADGHEWATSAMATDYLERSFAGWPRSYPAGNQIDERDALAYSPAGFLWDNALAHGRTLRDFGEFTLTHVRWKNPTRTNTPAFLDCYHDFVSGANAIAFSSEGSVDSLRPHVQTNTVGWALFVPDAFRARQFINALRQWQEQGSMPDLVILWLPNDHTSGAKPGFPKPASYVADNDLAFGQVIDALSHSAFWKDTCVFAIEDDPQNGWDHVSGYRTTCYVASPYTRRGAVVHTQYNQTSILRTIELILGLPPMNQMDATATPMFDCFTNVADLTPFAAVTNNVPLDQMNPEPRKITDRQLRRDAYVSAKLPLDKEDQCPPDLFARILWRATKGTAAAFPAAATVKIKDDD